MSTVLIFLDFHGNFVLTYDINYNILYSMKDNPVYIISSQNSQGFSFQNMVWLGVTARSFLNS